MRNVFSKLWNDDDGVIISIELLFIVTILIIGIVAGLASLRDAVATELTEVANAVLALDQTYRFNNLYNNVSPTEGSNGSATSDIAGTISLNGALASPVNSVETGYVP